MRKCDVNILQICPSQLSDIATLPREIKKVIFNGIIHTQFWLFTLSHFGTQCIHTKTVSRPTHERMLACNWNNTNIILAWISPGLRYALSALDPVPSGRGISSHRLPMAQKRFVAHTALNGYRPTLWCRPTKRTQPIFKAALCSAPGRGSEIRHSR